MYDVYACTFRTTNELMLSTHVPSKVTRLTKLHLASFTFIRFLVRVNTHVALQSTRVDENFSRTHHTRTVSRSCEYACGFSNYQIDVKRFSHTSHSYGFSFV